jgi:zinc protease
MLDNGMRIILMENHSAPMVASVVFVKSGARYESRFENGITHLLEHLLFDGTVNLSRKELNDAVQSLGGYINAFTTKDLTAYLVLVPSQFIKYGLTVQADMLFNSMIPEDELAKERKVVIEEINSARDRPGAPAEAFFIDKAYAETGYSRPVLGYRSFIEQIPREAIIAYWKKHYTPDRMIALIIGDFDSADMTQTATAVFGDLRAAMPSDTALASRSRSDRAGAEEKPPLSVGQMIYDTVANVTSTYVDLSFEAPSWKDDQYVPFSLLADYLDLDEVSPLKSALLSGDNPAATEVSVALETRDRFSRLDVSIITDQAERSAEIINKVVDVVSDLNAHIAPSASFEGVKMTIKCNDIYYRERLHYYGFMIAPLIMTAGWDFIQEYPDLVARTSWADCQAAAAAFLDNPHYIATIVSPAENPQTTPYVPVGLTVEEVARYFDTASFPQYDLVTAPKLTYPNLDSVLFEPVDLSVYHREILPNGLTVIIKSSDQSRVFAINALGKNRTANEPEGKAGITDFVNRCLEKGTLSRPAEDLSSALASIGANITLYDNPWIPYDDRYTTRRFSFFKFETIDEYAGRGWGLFSDMLLYPAFDSAAVEQVRSTMLGVIDRKTASPPDESRRLFFNTLFDEKAYARPIIGTAESIHSITIEDLRRYHRDFYSPENIILAIVTSRDTSEVLNWVRNTLGRISPTGFDSRQAEAPDPLIVPRTAHRDLDKSQVSMHFGNATPGAASEDAAPLQVATEILSERLFQNLREKQGLAYSTGATVQFDPGFGWYYATISTGFENYRKARQGLILEIDKLRLDGPSGNEIFRARNSLWGRLMRAKLSRINQAYYLTVDEYLDRGLTYDTELWRQLQNVDLEAIRRISARYFRTDTYVLTTAGHQPQ